MFNKRVLPLLLRFFVGLTFPLSAVITLSRLPVYFDVHIPIWIVVISATLSAPATLAFQVYRRFLRHRRAAAALGAVEPPVIRGRWLGNIDVLIMWMYAFYNRYPGNLNFPIFAQLSFELRVSCLPG